jgi:hypothetical protein
MARLIEARPEDPCSTSRGRTVARGAHDHAFMLLLRINVPDPTGAAGCSAFFPKVVFGEAQWLGL